MFAQADREGGKTPTPVTAGEVAEAAVAERGAGNPVPSTIANKVGNHLGADLCGVRVHHDEVSAEANAAMGARAFAFADDIFLGGDESLSDEALMAHELTHVVQQDAAERQGPQPALRVEPTNSPAEHEADRVADEVTRGEGPRIVDGEAGPGQMSRTQFLARLEVAVTDTADSALGPMWSAAGCPYIAAWFDRHSATDAASLERLAKRYSRLTNADRAEDYIPPICGRVRRGIETWRAGGDVSGDLSASGLGTDARAIPTVDEVTAPGTAAQKIASFGPGERLEPSVAARMGEAFDDNFANVEIHTGSQAAASVADEGALAVTIGENVAFAQGAYRPGTVEGDALLAHELAHTQQQRAAARDPAAMRSPIGTESAAHEDAADVAAGGVVSRLWSRVSSGAGAVVGRSSAVLPSGLQLQRCGGGTEPRHDFTPHRLGPHIGQRVGVLAEGGNMVTQEFVHRAVETLGEATSESQAITIAKVANVPAAIIADQGVFFVYRISVFEDLMGDTIFNPTLIANAGLRVDDGVLAIVDHGNVYRTGFHQGWTATDDARGAYQATFEPYLALHDGNLGAATEPEFLAIFEAAMRDNALAVLAESERQARAKRDQLQGGVDAVSADEQATIDETAREALSVQTEIEDKDRRRIDIRNRRMIGPAGPVDLPKGPEEIRLEREVAALRQRRREVNLGYPMLGRYESASDLREFINRDEAGRIAALAGDARSVLTNIATTRANILTGDLNLWLVRPVVDSTIAGMGVAEGTDQRRWVDAKAEAQTSRDSNTQIALAVLSIGLGLAAAFATGGTALILTAGAVGVGVYDAVRTTEDYFVREAGTDTDIDRIDGASLLPEDMRQHWGWLVLAWVGVGLDAFDVARVIGQVGRTTRGSGLIDEAAQALAAGDARLLERLRRAAGDVDIAETISEGNRAAVSRAVGAEITVDPRAGRSVEVLYEVDEASGRVAISGVRVGAAANVGDIVAHADTVRMLRRHGTLSGRLHDLWTRIRTFGAAGSANPFEAGTAAFNSFEELRKLEGLTATRRAKLREALEAGDDARPAQQELRRQLAFLENEIDRHQRVVDSLSDLRGGRGMVAMSDDTRAALEAGRFLPDHPGRALADLSNDEIASSAYYFVRNDDGTFEAVLKADRVAPEVPTSTAPIRTPAEISARADRVRAAVPNAAGLSDEVLDGLAELSDEVLTRLARSRAPQSQLDTLGQMLTADPSLATRVARLRNPRAALSGLTGTDPAELSQRIFRQRLDEAGVRAPRERVLAAAERSGISWQRLDELTNADLEALGSADAAIAFGRRGQRPGRALPDKLREAQEAIDGIQSVDGGVRDALRAELAHGHGLSDLPFLLDPRAALRNKFPGLPETVYQALDGVHDDALRSLESVSRDELQDIVAMLTRGGECAARDVNDILRSYMYKAQKAARRRDAVEPPTDVAARRGGTLEPPTDVAGRLGRSIDTLAEVRARGFPFGFESLERYEQFMESVRAGLRRRGIDGTPQVQGSAMHNRAPGDVDMEIRVSQAEFDRLAAEFADEASTRQRSQDLADHVRRGKIPSPYFFPHVDPPLAAEVRSLTRAEDGSGPLDVQATLIVEGSDFDLGPFL